MSATTQLPSLEPAATATDNAATGLSGLLEVVGTIGSDSPDSPLSSVSAALHGVEARVDIDLSGITERLPQAITTIRQAVPADAMRFVEDLERAYSQVTEFLQDSELAQQIQSGSNLEQTALAIVDDLLGLFQSRLAELAANLIGAEELATVTSALELIEKLSNDYAHHADELLPFLSAQLVGVAPGFLDDAVGHIDSGLSVLPSVSEDELPGELAPAYESLRLAADEVLVAVRDLDPAEVSQYATLEVRLRTLDVAIGAGFDALEAFYDALGVALEDHAWDAVFPAYADVLAELASLQISSVDEVVDQVAGVLDDFLARLTMVLSPEDLAHQITAFSGGIQQSFTQSPLGQARQILVDFLETVRAAIDEVPVEDVQQAVTEMLERIGQELDGLGISTVTDTIEAGFRTAQEFIDEVLGQDVLDQVGEALASVAHQFDEVPFDEVTGTLTEMVNSVGSVVQELEESLGDLIDEVRQLMTGLDAVSFTPVADEVIEEIDAVAAKLKSLKSESLSDAEELALGGALALLQTIDLDGTIRNELSDGFATIAQELKRLVGQVMAAWEDVRRRVLDFDPQTICAPLTGAFDGITGALEQLNGTALLDPMYDQLERLRQGLAALSPGDLLNPLRAPYAEMMAVVERVNPDVWVQPLRELHAEIDTLLGHLDVTPLLDTLEQKEREMFADARQAIIDGLDGVSLPEPLGAFYQQLKLVAVALADSVFGAPDEAIREFTLELGDSVRLSALFTPLDEAFDALLEMLDQVPREDVVTVMESLRVGLGRALVALDPREVLARLRERLARLAQLSPSAAAAALPTLPALRVSLEARLESAPAANAQAVASLLARFDLTLESVRPNVPTSRLRTVQARHEALLRTVRLKINALETSVAQAEYARLNASLVRALPAFLQQPEPLTYADIRGGLAEVRPSSKARRIDASLELFMSRLKSLDVVLEPAVNGFFATVKDAALILHPAALRDAVVDIYDALRDKLHVLDPDELAHDLRVNVYEPLLEPLEALDPEVIASQIGTLHAGVLGSLTGRVRLLLDEVKKIVDAVLGALRAAVATVIEELRAQIAAVAARLAGLLDRLDALIVDDLLGRLLSVIDNLQSSFDQELDRVSHRFHDMLDANPLGSGSSVTVSA